MSFFGKYYFCHSQHLPEGGEVIRQLLWEEGGGEASDSTHPPADVIETADGLVVQMDLPGVEAKDLQIAVSGEWLTVRGRRTPRQPRRHRSVHRLELVHGPFERLLPLPRPVRAEGAEAELRDGVLEVRLPLGRRAEAPPLLVRVRCAVARR